MLLDAYVHTWRGKLNVAVDQLREVVASYEGEWSRSAHQFAPVLMARVLVWQGQTSMVSKRLDAMATRPNTLPTYRLVQIPALRAYLALSEGRVLHARKMATEALTALDRLGHIGVIDACDAHLVLAGADRELENLDEARRHAEYVVERATQFGHVALAILGRCELARTAAAQGDRQRTMAELDQARRLGAANDVSRSLLRHVSRAEVDVALEWGDVARVHRALQPLATSEAHPVLAMRATVLDKPPSEGDVRAMLGRFPPTSPRQKVESHLLLVEALGADRPAEASSHLEAALRIAAEHGIFSALRGRGSLVLRLAEQLEVPGGAHDLKQILEAGDRARRNRRARTLPPLSQGEVVILERIVAGHGNRELAAELGISLNTVKTRIRRLYRKLGVTDRASLLSLLGQGL